MRDETKEIIDELMKQWGENKLYIKTGINKDNQEYYTIAKNTKDIYENAEQKDLKNFRDRQDNRQTETSSMNKEDIVCTILATRYSREDNEAYIYFRGSYSIDNDCIGVYSYIKEFLAVIKAKSRQMNALGVKYKLGMITDEKLNEINNVYVENKQEVLEKLFEEKKEYEIPEPKRKVFH